MLLSEMSDSSVTCSLDLRDMGLGAGQLTCLLQGHHGRLLDQVPLDEAPEVLAVHAQVRQLEGVDGHLQRELLGAAVTRHVGAGQGDDGGAGVGNPPRKALFYRGGEDHRSYVGVLCECAHTRVYAAYTWHSHDTHIPHDTCTHDTHTHSYHMHHT